jgi:hypothetical protein
VEHDACVKNYGSKPRGLLSCIHANMVHPAMRSLCYGSTGRDRYIQQISMTHLAIDNFQLGINYAGKLRTCIEDNFIGKTEIHRELEKTHAHVSRYHYACTCAIMVATPNDIDHS